MNFKFCFSEKAGLKAKKKFVFSYDWYMDKFMPVCVGIIMIVMIILTIYFYLDMRSIQLEHEERVKQIIHNYEQQRRAIEGGRSKHY